jgi:uncharacterized phage-associated protein
MDDASVFDVAACLLKKHGPMTAMKLQRLVYYSQAWALVWDDQPLFAERIEAWANGPVCVALYDAHRGQFDIRLEDIAGDPAVLDEAEIETLDSVLDYYGGKSSQWLSELTHAEPPWKDARKGLDPGDRSDKEITAAAMAEYYGSLC